MAINIEWQTLPNQTNNTADKSLLYPRMTENETVNMISFCEKVAKYSSLTKGTVTTLIYDMAEVIAKLLHEGKTIDLEDFGTFRLSIGTDANITSDIPYSKRQITVRGVNFQPHKTLIDAIGIPCFRTIPRSARITAMPQEQLQEILLEYFKTHDYITRSQFEKLCQLKRATACVRLKKLVDSDILIKIGTNRDTKYTIGTMKDSTTFAV